MLHHIDGHVLHAAKAIQHGFRQGGVGVDGEHQLLDGRLQLQRHYRFGDHLGRLRPDDVHPQQLSVFGIRNHLHKAFVGADDRGLGVGGEGKLAHLDLVTGRLGLRSRSGRRCRSAARSRCRRGCGRGAPAWRVCRPAWRQPPCRPSPPRGPTGAGRPPRRRWQRCPALRSASTHRCLIKPRSTWTLVLSRPRSAVRGARPTATSTFSASFTTCLPSAAVKVTLAPACGLLYLLHLGAGMGFDAPLAKDAGKLLAHILIFIGHGARQVLDDGDLAAEALEDGAELHPHRPGADDHHRLGDLRQREDFHVGQDAACHPLPRRATCGRRSRWRSPHSLPGPFFSPLALSTEME